MSAHTVSQLLYMHWVYSKATSICIHTISDIQHFTPTVLHTLKKIKNVSLEISLWQLWLGNVIHHSSWWRGNCPKNPIGGFIEINADKHLSSSSPYESKNVSGFTLSSSHTLSFMKSTLNYTASCSKRQGCLFSSGRVRSQQAALHCGVRSLLCRGGGGLLCRGIIRSTI